ncbi:right-handed parallel beta-helix repeat-containing protein [Aurantiacibacter sp. MUD11]|uniref:right-handed parallel beta-helix repeat-containing protein n=1 Tax=Aurantiacibacter sp. MUD11 TaxID=3003265 RepID=UPI0022AA1F94|nr:right-handed parallel beta-helix repeat-containing protein [Aurantiacibacter sp. MUD11]WAT16985.1 right-handed parallel beta-helix repeat-containing protein [Aurantiacibacter sp. MUD11]
MNQQFRPRAPRVSLGLIGLVAGIAVAAIPLAALFAQDRAAPFTVVETGRGYQDLQDAVNAIGNARGTIAIAPGRYEQCAVQEAGQVAYLAAEPGSVVFDGVTCEGKAALVLRGVSAEVAGLVFENMRVPDYNGAGIRLEQGDLTVAESWFRDSQQGILTHNDTGGQLVIDRSTFTRLGTCEGSGGCAHSIYTGEYGYVRVTRSRFEEGRGGHYVKSRAIRVDVASSSFDDTRGRGTNYMIDLPGGASGQISNNWFVQGQDKENYAAFIAVAAEGRAHDSSGLVVVGNDARFATGVDRNSIFVADWSGDMGGVGDNRLDRRLTRYEVIR